MSHEIRTPLNGILGFTKVLLQGGEIHAEESREHLSTIHRSAVNLVSLVNDILDLSKIEAGHLDVDRVACSPGEIIAEVASLLRPRALEKGVRLEARCAGGVATIIETDRERLRQLVMNLTGNAVKFTEHGFVSISAWFVEEAGRPQFRIEVADTGIGIPADCLEGIFNPFVQVDNSVTRKYSGTGLGLSISRHIAAALGGRLTAESQLGKGTVFTADIDPGKSPQDLALELLPVEAHRPKAEVVPRHKLNLRGRILLVEDGDTNRRLVGLVLRRVGLEVVDAENGEIGVEKATHEPFDLILMDMQMPVMDGYTATRRLRQQGLTTPIIALTAHAMKGSEEECRSAGCSGYLAKPIDVDQLINVVQEILRANDGALTEKGPQTSPDVRPLTSTLPADDPEFHAIVAEFRDCLAGQLDSMRRALEVGDFNELGRLAHWLKGTGGTVGFTVLSQQAIRLQQFAEQQSAVAIVAALADLESTAARILVEPAKVDGS
jgi:CheY-like chemotaxis protein/HPt (histidine-containing phosphotransfer) domain-containing protein